MTTPIPTTDPQQLATSIVNLVAMVSRVENVTSEMIADGIVVSRAMRPLINRTGPVRVGFGRWYGPARNDEQAIRQQNRSWSKRGCALNEYQTDVRMWEQFANDLPRIAEALGTEIPGIAGGPSGATSLSTVAAALRGRPVAEVTA